MGRAGYFIDAETIAWIVAVGALVGFADFALRNHQHHGNAGVLNLLAALHAFEAARGHKA